jgi:hypothetical protein
MATTQDKKESSTPVLRCPKPKIYEGKYSFGGRESGGMYERDYFAGQVISHLLSHVDARDYAEEDRFKIASTKAYKLAEIMVQVGLDRLRDDQRVYQAELKEHIRKIAEKRSLDTHA